MVRPASCELGGYVAVEPGGGGGARSSAAKIDDIVVLFARSEFFAIIRKYSYSKSEYKSVVTDGIVTLVRTALDE